MRTITDAPAATLADQRFIDNCLGRYEMRTRFEATSRGRARRYNIENCLEIAFTHAIATAGIKTSSAIAFADRLRQDRYLDFRSFLVFANADPKHFLHTDSLDTDNWPPPFATAVAFSVIQTKAILEHVDSYFEANGEEI